MLRRDEVEEELIRVAHEWDRAMVENDADAIGWYMADDWTIIGTDGSVGDKATFLGLVKGGTLSHDVMESEDLRVRVYGGAAVVTSRGVSGGKYNGQAFHEVEQVSCVFVRQEGRWRCVLTHLSRIPQAAVGGEGHRSSPRRSIDSSGRETIRPKSGGEA